MSTFKLLLRFLKGNGSLYTLAMIMVVISVIFGFLPPVIIGFTVDSVIGEKPINLPTFIPRVVTQWIEGIGTDFLRHNMYWLGLMLVAVSLIVGLSMYYRSKAAAHASENIAKTMRDRLFHNLQKLPFEYHVKAKTGDLIQRCTSDLDTVRRFLASQLVMMFRAIVLLVASVIFMAQIDGLMTLVSFALVPIIFFFSYYYFNRISKKFKDVDEAEGRMSNVLQENLTGVRVVRAFARQKFESEKFDEKNSEFRNLVIKLVAQFSVFWSISDGLSILQHGLVLCVGTYWAATGRITTGMLIIFLSFEQMMLWPVRQLGRMLSEMSKMSVSLKRIYEVLDEPAEDMNLEGLKPDINSDIVFDNVTFAYGDDKPVLKNISFTAKKGQTIAILGSTGSGKSSMVHLLQRLYDYQSGSIKIGGEELTDINKEWLRERIGLVLQEPFLFSRSIKENITLAYDVATDQEIHHAADTAAVHNVIEEFEKGYDTLVGERGVTLSGGQKQRVAIARTLIRDCDVLIFDDSLSAVDTETDARIRKALLKRNDNTTFIISHRITTLAEADLILVLDEGELVEMGTHNELVDQPGLYKRIWDIQNTLEDEMDAV